MGLTDDKTKECEKAILRIASGDGEALSVIYESYGRLIYSTALTVMRDAGKAEDVLQDVMLRLLRYSGSYKKGTDPRAWIMRMTKNCALDALKRDPPVSALPEDAADGDEFPDDFDDALGHAALRDAVESLGETDQRIVKLRAYSGYSHGEIAEMLGISAALVRKRYERAIKKLGKMLG